MGLTITLLINTVLSSEKAGAAMPNKILNFASPLQTFTIYPKEKVIEEKSPRERYVPKLKAGLAAERKAKIIIKAKEQYNMDNDDDYIGEGWDKKSAQLEKYKEEENDLKLERAFDRAVAPFSKSRIFTSIKKNTPSKKSSLQFVGLVHPPKNGKNVTWYARERPSESKWNLRLVHANRDAILRDLFIKGKVDVYGEYVNTGKSSSRDKEDQDSPAAVNNGKPLIQAKYTLKNRSWKNLLNFNPRHFFKDSSGAFWRERRLSPGIYTDGQDVYEQMYRFSDGKNGMKPAGTLAEFLVSNSVKKEVKQKILKRLENDSPDVVLER